MSLQLRNQILIGDVRDRLSEIPDASVDCIITSPPYYQLRDYGVQAFAIIGNAAVSDIVAVPACSRIIRVEVGQTEGSFPAGLDIPSLSVRRKKVVCLLQPAGRSAPHPSSGFALRTT